MGASALLVGLVLACKSSKKADEPLTIGTVTVDPTGIVIAGTHGKVTISEHGITVDGGDLGNIGMSPGLGVSVQKMREGKTVLGTLGAGTLGLGGDAARINMMAISSASINLTAGDYQARIYANDGAAALSLDRVKDSKLGYSASMHVNDLFASVSAKAETMSATLTATHVDVPTATVSATELAKVAARLVVTPGAAKLDIPK